MRVLGAVLLFAISTLAAAQEITVAAAADLNYALREIAAKFETQSGNKVKLSFGSSGNITSQIRNGAPYDVFFSADVQFPLDLQKEGLVEENSLYEYAVGRIVMWVPNTSKLHLQNGLRALLDPSVNKIAIANPQHAPYGRAAVAALRSAGVYDQVQPKLVLGENISQAAQFVQTGNADAGIIALSLALSPAMKNAGRYYEIDPKSYPEIRQAAVVLRSSKNKQAAQAFLQFVKSEAAQKIMRSYGFKQPSPK